MGPTNHIAHTSGPDAEFDALADLFLGDRPATPVNGAPVAPTNGASSATPMPSAAAPKNAGVDLVVLGHLPVRSGPWVLRYAAARAATLDAPVALVRVQEGHASVDLIAPNAESVAKPPKSSSLEAALVGATPLADELIVAVDAVEELGLAARAGVSTVTVLTGANEAAVVEAYRAIKALGASIADRTDEVAIRIAVMGADADRAEQVHRKLTDASRAFIGREITLAAVGDKIDATPSANLYRGSTDIEPADLVDAIAKAARPPVQAPAPAPAPVPTAPRILRPSAPTVEPRPIVAAEPIRAASTTPEIDVLALIGGLTPLPTPGAPDDRVRAGRDANGRIHLVRTDDGGVERAIAGLMGVETWARTNRGLLELAWNGPIEGDPTLHLITTNAAATHALLASRIRVHALARATGPYAAVPIN